MSMKSFITELFGKTNFILLESLILMVIYLYHFHGRKLKEKENEYMAYIHQFLSVFVLFFLIPFFTIIIMGYKPAKFGINLNNWKQGIIYVVIGIVVALIIGISGKNNKEITKQYPFSKEAMKNTSAFLKFEIFYLLFYYTGWEFLFRGVLLFSLAPINPMLAIIVQTIPSTLLHIGHPESENWAALLAGLVFGYIAYTTGSVLYTFIIHASIGIATDTFIFIYKNKQLSLKTKNI